MRQLVFLDIILIKFAQQCKKYTVFVNMKKKIARDRKQTIKLIVQQSN